MSLLLAAGCSSDDDPVAGDSVAGGSSSSWDDTFCAGVIDYARSAESQQVPDGMSRDQVDAEKFGEVLATADGTGGQPSSEYVESVEAFRDDVAAADPNMDVSNPFMATSICNDAVVDWVHGDRFILDAAPEGFAICSATDLDVIAGMMDSEPPEQSDLVSLWGEAPLDDVTSGLAVLVQSPQTTNIVVPTDVEEGLIAVRPGAQPDVFEIELTYPESLAEPSDAVGDLVLPNDPNPESSFDKIDAVVYLTVFGADEETAVNIAESVRIADGELSVTYPGFEPLVPPKHVGFLLGEHWMIMVQSQSEGIITIGSADLTVADVQAISSVSDFVDGDVLLPDMSAGEDSDELATTQAAGFAPRSFEADGHPAFFLGDGLNAVAYIDMGEVTVQATMIGGLEEERAFQTLQAVAKGLESATPDGWLTFVNQYWGRMNSQDPASPCATPGPGSGPPNPPTAPTPMSSPSADPSGEAPNTAVPATRPVGTLPGP
ncbi:MAG: hypothetical protein KDB86_01745 [Actinobacteria bacterium]|nr:hypothetical protein [Actinomycetota bacterium]